MLSSIAIESALKVGAARVDITPFVPVPLAGYVAIRPYEGGPEDHRVYVPRVGPSEGIHDRIYARAVAFSNQTTTAVMVGLDVCVVPLRFTKRIRAAAQSRWGIDGDGIVLAASHSHSGPDYTGQWESVDPSVETNIAELTLSAIGQALSSLQPATIGSGEGELAQVVINRRDASRPVDPRVSVIRADDQYGRPIAVLYCFACHPIVVGSANRLISAEYPGYCSSVVESAFGPPTVALFLNGAAGNINPVAFPYSGHQNISSLAKEYMAAGRPVTFRTHADAFRLGLVLAGEVVKIGGMTATASTDTVRFERRQFEAELKQPEELDKYLHHMNIPDETANYLRRRTSIETEVVAIRLGDSILVCIPGEPFVEIGLDLQALPAHSSNVQLRVIGYANDYPGYLLRVEDYLENRYETTSTPLASSGAARIIDVARGLRDRVMGAAQ